MMGVCRYIVRLLTTAACLENIVHRYALVDLGHAPIDWDHGPFERLWEHFVTLMALGV